MKQLEGSDLENVRDSAQEELLGLLFLLGLQDHSLLLAWLMPYHIMLNHNRVGAVNYSARAYPSQPNEEW